MVVVNDTHCGSYFGLTPPGYGFSQDTDDEREIAISKTTGAIWNFWENTIAALNKEKPIDILLMDGDMIEGNGEKNGGVEVFYTDRMKQAEMAAKAMSIVGAKKNILVFGTPYHTGTGENFEECLSKHMIIHSMHDALDLRIYDFIFNVRHKVNSSSVPHGRATALAKEAVWNLLKAERETGIKADFIIRAHVHYHIALSDGYQTCIANPCMQAPGSRYGKRICSGITDIGFSVFDIDKEGVKWDTKLFQLKYSPEQLLSL